MNCSQVGISNGALRRIGARPITSLSENSANAVKVVECWDSVFQEVLSERDWRFAKTRVSLALLAVNSEPVRPVYAYRHAWALPSDLLRFVRPHKKPHTHNAFAWLWGPEGWGWYHRDDPPFWPPGYPYVIEAVLNGNLDSQDNPQYQQCALTDYGGFHGPAKINYIRLITDYTQLMPGFVNCLTYRLAQELAISVTEDKQKFELMEQKYKDSLNSAEAQNECLDYEEDEAGSDSWERAGRRVWGW